MFNIMEIILVNWSRLGHILVPWTTEHDTGPLQAVRLSTKERFKNESIG
jgi:hypothetical protein